MKKIKGLLYCTKKKPSLMKYENIDGYYTDTDPVLDKRALLNGKIVAECDFEVEEHKETTIDWLCMSLREKIIFGNMCEKANIDELECYKYANGKPLYAIHIKNLHIFDEPKELDDFTTRTPVEYDSFICDSCTFGFDCKKCKYYYDYQQVIKAPKNMMKVCEWDIEDKVLISIQPQELCRILNGEQTILIKKKVLKEMLENE